MQSFEGTPTRACNIGNHMSFPSSKKKLSICPPKNMFCLTPYLANLKVYNVQRDPKSITPPSVKLGASSAPHPKGTWPWASPQPWPGLRPRTQMEQRAAKLSWTFKGGPWEVSPIKPCLWPCVGRILGFSLAPSQRLPWSMKFRESRWRS